MVESLGFLNFVLQSFMRIRALGKAHHRGEHSPCRVYSKSNQNKDGKLFGMNTIQLKHRKNEKQTMKKEVRKIQREGGKKEKARDSKREHRVFFKGKETSQT
jgi:hypothetical protein